MSKLGEKYVQCRPYHGNSKIRAGIYILINSQTDQIRLEWLVVGYEKLPQNPILCVKKASPKIPDLTNVDKLI